MNYYVVGGRIPAGLTSARAFLYGTLAVGTLHLADAFLYYGLVGNSPKHVLQNIASGVIGSAAQRGGFLTAFLGLALNFLIAYAIVRICYIIGKRYDWLLDHPKIFGAIYGMCTWAVLNLLVVPLSPAEGFRLTTLGIANGLLICTFGVGLPAAIFVSRIKVPRQARRTDSAEARDRARPTRGAPSPT